MDATYLFVKTTRVETSSNEQKISAGYKKPQALNLGAAKKMNRDSIMEYDKDKVDEYTLALLYLVTHDIREGFGARAWKGFDWETMNRL